MITEVELYLLLFPRRTHYFLLIMIVFVSIGGVLAPALPLICRAYDSQIADIDGQIAYLSDQKKLVET